MASPEKHTNRLINEKSPYLLQHAHNPVDWYPWGEEAFEKARSENKPIFLSVGYSTCHWCHVMEHESFEDEETAKVMNKYFVNVKVDREENPGVDKMYMTYIQLSVGGGGWPMSVFLSPELHPFFGGTYFPGKDMMGKPSFKTILTRIAHIWAASPDKLLKTSKASFQQLKTFINAKPSSSKSDIDPHTTAEIIYGHFADSFDTKYAGFGSAPKFPTPVQLQFLFEFYGYYRHEKPDVAESALMMGLQTLKHIASGGIHDHVGGGFHRYSTDNRWHVPHFEKMLYDQAQLLHVYSLAFQISKDQTYAECIKDIVRYVSGSLRHNEGGFFAAEDADSYPTPESKEKKEGAFCVWEYEELVQILGAQDAAKFAYFYGVHENGNVDPEQDPHGELHNKNVLMEEKTTKEMADHFGVTEESVVSFLENAREKLWEYRKSKRPMPHRDDKILSSWNGLMISGLAFAYQAIGDEDYLALAVDAAAFIKKELYLSQTKTLLRSYCEGRSTIEGFLDDYSYLIQGLLDLYEVSFDEQFVGWASELQDKQNDLFYDHVNGGYYNVSQNDKTILLRVKEEQDGAEPSANAITIKNLMRLSVLLDKKTYSEQAQATLNYFKPSLNKFPFAVPALASAMLQLTGGLKEVILAGEDRNLEIFKTVVYQTFAPNKLLAYAKQNGYLAQRNTIIQKIAEKQAAQLVKAEAYVCENFACGLPIQDPSALREKILNNV